MRKLILFTVAILYVAFIASNALGISLYKAGNISVGAGYATSSYNISGTGTGSGFMGQISYFLMDDLNIGVQYYSSSFPDNFFGSVGESILDINIGSHLVFDDVFGLYAKLGYSSSTFTFPAPTQATSGGGLIAEVGLEGKLSENIIGFAGIKTLSANNNAITGGKYSNLGFNAGFNFIF